MASRTVGSPQIRNRGTVGGNLGSASPAGDAHPPLLAAARWSRSPPCAARGGPRRASSSPALKQSALAADELIAAVHVPRAGGPQQFAKIGTRNAMVIAVVLVRLALDPDRAPGRHRHRLGRPDAARGRRGRGLPRGRAGGGRAWDRGGRCPTRRSARSASWSPRPRGRSTTSGHGRLPRARARRAGAAHARLGLETPEGADDAGHVHRQRRAQADRRRLGGREPALRAARAHGPAGLEERLRAGRVRLLHRSTSTAPSSAPAWCSPAQAEGARS